MKKNYTGTEWSDNRLARFQVGVIAALLFAIYAFNYETEVVDSLLTVGELEDVEIEQLVEVFVATPPRTKTINIASESTDSPIIDELTIEITQPEQAAQLEDYTHSETEPSYRKEQAMQLPLPSQAEPEIEEIVTTELVHFAERMPLYSECVHETTTYEEQLECSRLLMLRYIQKHLSYPVVARENGIEDTVVASFVVNTDGKMTAIKIEREHGMGFGKAVTAAIAKIPAMLSGEQNSRKVNVKMYVPVKFRLSD